MVSADYRLLPESSGMDMLEDIADVWKWVRNDLQAHLNSQTGSTMGIDLAKVAVLGDSSGGYCAVQSTLTQPAGSFKLVIALYPQIDLESEWFTRKASAEFRKTSSACQCYPPK